jgi:hypothetical protein
MNNTVINLGCSWTYGHGLEDSETYSAHLQKLFPKYKFINAGHCGSDIDYAIFSGVKLIEEYNPKAVIFQLTSFDRVTLGTDGFENFLKNDFTINRDSNIYYGDSDKENVRVIGINNGIKTKYTHGSYVASETDRIEELEHANMKQANLKKYKNFVDILYENIVYSEYEFDKKINNLFLFKKYLELKNIKSLWFFWLHSPNRDFFKNFFKDDNFIDIPLIKWFEKNYPNENFYIDNGYHVSSAGNQILAEHYLLPYIKQIL